MRSRRSIRRGSASRCRDVERPTAGRKRLLFPRTQLSASRATGSRHGFRLSAARAPMHSVSGDRRATARESSHDHASGHRRAVARVAEPSAARARLDRSSMVATARESSHVRAANDHASGHPLGQTGDGRAIVRVAEPSAARAGLDRSSMVVIAVPRCSRRACERATEVPGRCALGTRATWLRLLTPRGAPNATTSRRRREPHARLVAGAPVAARGEHRSVNDRRPQPCARERRTCTQPPPRARRPSRSLYAVARRRPVASKRSRSSARAGRWSRSTPRPEVVRASGQRPRSSSPATPAAARDRR